MLFRSRQKLIDLFSLVLLVTAKVGSGWNKCFELVDEYHGRCLLGSSIEELTNSNHALVNVGTG